MTIPDYFRAEAYADAVPTDWKDAGLSSHQRIAARLSIYGAGKICYANGTGWRYWTGTHWAVDERAVKANEVLTDLLKVSWAEAIADKALQSDVRASMTASGSNGVLDLASRQLFVQELDTDPYLLNCQNGTLDLHTLELRPHNPADYITKVTGCDFDATAYAEDWTNFLESSLPVGEVREFLQRFAGLSLIGRVIEHVLVIATGSGRNGKSVLANALSKALGDYAITASNDMLIASRYGQRSAGELASRMRLRGTRFAVMSELEKGDKLAESTMKSLTGGDTIEAKFMGQNPVEFAPSHTFFMLTNDLPKVDADATAVWARMRIVPFDVSFEGREDTGLEARLELNLSSVLNWAVMGLAGYQDEGLAAPPAVMARTESYRAENDSFRQFIEDKCVLHPDARATSAELASTYSNWAMLSGEQALSQKELGAALGHVQGLTPGKVRGSRGWKGIGIAQDGETL